VPKGRPTSAPVEARPPEYGRFWGGCCAAHWRRRVRNRSLAPGQALAAEYGNGGKAAAFDERSYVMAKPPAVLDLADLADESDDIPHSHRHRPGTARRTLPPLGSAVPRLPCLGAGVRPRGGPGLPCSPLAHPARAQQPWASLSIAPRDTITYKLLAGRQFHVVTIKRDSGPAASRVEGSVDGRRWTHVFRWVTADRIATAQERRAVYRCIILGLGQTRDRLSNACWRIRLVDRRRPTLVVHPTGTRGPA